MNNTKKYSKPQIVFESFELSTNIAAGCQHSANHYQGSCSVTIGGKPVFMAGVEGCQFTVQDEYAGMCYTIPLADNSVFAS